MYGHAISRMYAFRLQIEAQFSAFEAQLSHSYCFSHKKDNFMKKKERT